MRHMIRVAAAAVCSVAAFTAQAALVTVQYSGVVDSSSGEFQVPEGTSISGQLTYDTSRRTCLGGDGHCTYVSANKQELEYAAPNPVKLSMPYGDVFVSNSMPDYPGSTLFLFGGNSLSVGGLQLDGQGAGVTHQGSISLILVGSQFTDLTLPDHLDLSQFDVSSTGSAYLDFSEEAYGQTFPYYGEMAFHLTSLTTVSPVPEPSMAWLGGLGLIGVLAGVRQQRRKTLPPV